MINLFPPKYHFLLLSIKNILMGGYRRASWSQAGEDLIASLVLENKKKGFYVDVGAHHPLRGSNTQLFYKRGWSGINIEPNPGLHILFSIFRSRDVNLSVGVAATDGTADFFMFSEPGLNTFNEEEADKLKKRGNVSFLKKITVPVCTLRAIFEKYQVSKVDLLSVDAEGLDVEVMKSNDWTRWEPTVIIVEDNAFDASDPSKSGVYNFLLNKGYWMVASTGVTMIFKLVNSK